MAGVSQYLRQQTTAPSFQRRRSFTDRLHHALKAAGYRPNEHSLLARDFNAVHSGKPIGVSSVFRWLSGEAMPTADKLETLAHLLNVCPDWLRDGS